MIYYILRFYCRIAVWINFRKVYLEHYERIPDRSTLIFGLNHPTAFLDPIILGTHYDPPCWYMLRGDKFVNAPVRWFLHKIQNLPIYRERDGGHTGVKNNIHTMDFATDRVIEGEPTIILSEGVCKHERRLRPIQRGTARIMFQAYSKDPTAPVAIVPTVINYTAANRFRSSVYLTFAEPIYAADYAERFAVDERATIDEVTAEVQSRLAEYVIHVADRHNDALVDAIVPIVKNCFPDGGILPTAHYVPARKSIYHAVEQINDMSPDRLSTLSGHVNNYTDLLATCEITDNGLANPRYGTALRALILLLSGPIAILGLLLHYPLAMITQRQAEKQVANPQFFASVRWGLGMAIYLGVVALWTLALSLVIGWFSLLIPLVFAFTGWFSLICYESFDLLRKSARLASLSDTQRSQLTALREQILTMLDVAVDRVDRVY